MGAILTNSVYRPSMSKSDFYREDFESAVGYKTANFARTIDILQSARGRKRVQSNFEKNMAQNVKHYVSNIEEENEQKKVNNAEKRRTRKTGSYALNGSGKGRVSDRDVINRVKCGVEWVTHFFRRIW